MTNRQNTHFSFADHTVMMRRKKHSFLDDVNSLVNWQPISKFLDKKLQRKHNAIGSPSYPAIAMFKILLLQRWYNLSDPAMEQNLLDRLSFLRFIEFSLDQEIPDETTICRFRNDLIKLDILDDLLEMINKQFERKGLLVRKGAVVDASVIGSSRRPRKVIDIAPEDRKEDDATDSESPKEDSVTVSYSDDTDAAWLRKGKRTFYGYKVHAAVDSSSGFLLGGHSTPANKSDIGQFEQLVEEISTMPGMHVYADKGYSSKKNRSFLKDKNIFDGIMHKATRGKPLKDDQKEENRAISNVRYIVEQSFGTMKRAYNFSRTRYKGIEKVTGELHIIGLAFNIKKAVRLCCV